MKKQDAGDEHAAKKNNQHENGKPKRNKIARYSFKAHTHRWNTICISLARAVSMHGIHREKLKPSRGSVNLVTSMI